MSRWNNTLQTSTEIARLKRDAVLRESGRLFNRQGYHNTSLDDIAKVLGVSKGTLYNYVSDKQEILFAFHNMGMDVSERAFAHAMASDLNGLGKLRLALLTYIRDVGEELGGYGVIAEVGALKTADREVVLARREKLNKSFMALIQAGVADGSIRGLDPMMALFTFLGAVQLIPNWFSPNGRLTAAQVADSIVDILIHGMAAPRRPAAELPPPSEPPRRTRKPRSAPAEAI